MKFWKNKQKKNGGLGLKGQCGKKWITKNPDFSGFSRGADRIWTGAYWCCRPLPYRLATAPCRTFYSIFCGDVDVADPRLTTWLLRLAFYLIICYIDFKNDSNGNRTRVTAVKGRCLNRLTMEPGYSYLSCSIEKAPFRSARFFQNASNALLRI